MRVAPEGFEPLGQGVAGWRLGLRASGGAPPLVLLPGIEGDARVFARQVPLSRHRGVYALDLPAGRSLEAMAAHVADAFDRLGLDRVAVVGSSLGGLVGRALAARDPGRLLGLVAFGTLPARACLPDNVRLGRRLLSCTPGPLFDLQYQRRIQGRLADEGVPEPLCALLTSALPSRPVLIERLQAIEAWGLPERIGVTALWLRGATDREAPWGATEVHRHLPGVAYETVPGGHRAPLTHPEAFHASVLGFFAGRA